MWMVVLEKDGKAKFEGSISILTGNVGSKPMACVQQVRQDQERGIGEGAD